VYTLEPSADVLAIVILEQSSMVAAVELTQPSIVADDSDHRQKEEKKEVTIL
jgi:hypothetical protein